MKLHKIIIYSQQSKEQLFLVADNETTDSASWCFTLFILSLNNNHHHHHMYFQKISF